MFNLIKRNKIPIYKQVLFLYLCICPFILKSQVNQEKSKLSINYFFGQYESLEYKWIVNNHSLYSILFDSIESNKNEQYLRYKYCLTMSYFYLEDYFKAEKHIVDIQNITKNVYGENSSDFAGILTILAPIYFKIGETNKALELLMRCDKIQSKHLKTEISILFQIGVIHERNQNYSLAISALERIISFTENSIEPVLKIKVLCKLAELNHNLNLMDQSLKYINLALECARNEKETIKADYYNVLFNLSTIYSDMCNYDAAINVLTECEKYYLTLQNFADYNLVKMSEAFIFIQKNQIKKAKECLNKIHQNNLVDYTYVNYLKGILAFEEQSYKKAISFFNKSKSDLNPSDYQGELNSLNQYLIRSLLGIRQYHNLDTLIFSDLKNTFNKYNQNKIGLSSEESINFKTKITNKVMFDFGYAVFRRKENIELINEIYNIWFKLNGELSDQSRRLKNLLLESAQTDLINFFYRINFLKSNDYPKSQIEKLEREFNRNLAQNFKNNSEISLSTLQNELVKSEAVFLDFVKLPKYNFNDKKWTDLTQYLIFISDSKDSLVDYVFIEDGLKIDEELFDQYNQEATDSEYKTDLKSEKFFNYFWKPIANKIGDAKTIYVSLGGVYNNINLNTLYNPETGKYLLEEKDIRIVNSGRDFVLSKENKKKTFSTNTASLFGFPDFNGNTTVAEDSTDFLASTRDLNSFWLDSLTRGGLYAKPLPATKIEVENISLTLKSKGWQVNSFLADNASETNIKKQESPRILHIATHGYFFPDVPMDKENTRFLGMDRQQVVQDPMLRSGLLFTGANKTLKGEESKGENGLLSAVEASLLNLRETELVVLSACETGKGEVKNSEGVYGLRKAFSDAGAKNIIMSLWKVDDKVTQEFMSRFYEIWLNNKTSIREAYNKTQLEIKAKYPEPYYWGAFILVGE